MGHYETLWNTTEHYGTLLTPWFTLGYYLAELVRVSSFTNTTVARTRSTLLSVDVYFQIAQGTDMAGRVDPHP